MSSFRFCFTNSCYISNYRYSHCFSSQSGNVFQWFFSSLDWWMLEAKQRKKPRALECNGSRTMKISGNFAFLHNSILVSFWVLFICCSTVFFCTSGNAALSLAKEEAMNIGMQWLKNTRQYQETFLYPVVNLGKMDFETT